MNNLFFKNTGPHDINNLLEAVGLKNQKFSNDKIIDIKDLSSSKSGEISFFHTKKYNDLAKITKASYCLTTENLKSILPTTCKAIISNNVLLHTAQITKIFYPDSVTDDFDNTALTLAVEGTDYGIELSANETSRSFELHTNDMPVAQYAVGMTDNESARDWSVSVTPSVSQDVRSFTLYVEPLFGLNWGDNHDKTQLELTPTILTKVLFG
mgnify:CR=1 FL=1